MVVRVLFFFLMVRRQPGSTLFPYTTLFRSENALAEDPRDARFHLWAEGLQEGLGLATVGEEVYVLQRGELSRVSDTDGDDRVDRVETISMDWGLSGNYHEFGFGLPRDDAGSFYASFNVGFWDPQGWHGRSRAEHRGGGLRFAPDGRTPRVGGGVWGPGGLGRFGGAHG